MTIRPVVEGLKPYVSEVIVVDDHSSDHTASAAAAAGAVVLRHEINCGYDKSIDDGFAKAACRDADVILTFDADGEHAAEDVPRILAPIINNSADIVAGQRPRITHFGEKLFGLYTRMHYGISDPLCGLKAYRRAVYESIGYFDTVGSIGTQLMLEGLRKGFRFALVPVEFRVRIDGTSRIYRNRFLGNMKILRAMLRVILV